MLGRLIKPTPDFWAGLFQPNNRCFIHCGQTIDFAGWRVKEAVENYTVCRFILCATFACCRGSQAPLEHSSFLLSISSWQVLETEQIRKMVTLRGPEAHLWGKE